MPWWEWCYVTNVKMKIGALFQKPGFGSSLGQKDCCKHLAVGGLNDPRILLMGKTLVVFLQAQKSAPYRALRPVRNYCCCFTDLLGTFITSHNCRRRIISQSAWCFAGVPTILYVKYHHAHRSGQVVTKSTLQKVFQNSTIRLAEHFSTCRLERDFSKIRHLLFAKL